MVSTTAGHSDRGREADKPRHLPKAGWRDILLRLNAEITRDYLSLVAAGVAFYFLLSIVPALTAMVSLYGLVADPQDVAEQIAALEGMVPPEAMSIIESQMADITAASAAGLGLGAALSIAFALWSTNTGIRALIKGMNIAYDEEEKRGFIKFTAVSFAFTLGAVLFALLTLAILAVVPALLALLPVPALLEGVVSFVRWPVLAVMMILALAILYRYAPSRSQPQWSWVSWGAVAATLAWLLGSLLFSIYVSNFADYNETYGSMGAIVILMLWFWITAFVVVLGGALNAEMEHQTRKDTTVGPDRPMGKRDAQKADHLGERP
ncbi:hypothetical protein CAI21_04025 [Alkalilimnicola ehrlichii]|uniref:YihY/virulence factor BrkB family protein n=1 Tax=Alkalilimnicola ehrlichii TaxID=351052 RepID=UPI000E2F48AB|nr:YihY/virulence factor BrkB family protein [Alkalilimnicola ehrlichii]RFA30692.1 hypothetical protein CAI21_04025 [Alkalilimnicola ehrlichii]